jgi:Chlorophyllase enzyme
MLRAMKFPAGRRFKLRALLMLVPAAAIAMIGGTARAAQPPNAPTLPIEQKYYAAGPWAVTSVTGFACCDSSGTKFDVWYPTRLGQNGFRHPIITWGNGTNAIPSQYAYLLSHLASWGFVVVASENKNTGTGQEILDAARFMVAQNGQASSIFHNKLATNQVGASGHSQGASGVLNAMVKSAGLIKTAIPIELPAQLWCSTNTATCADTRNLSSGAVFFVNGSADTIISPSTQALPWQVIGLQSYSAYYDATPASVAKLWGTLNGPNHNDVQGQPDCAAASQPCVNGVYGYLGYPTAWMMDRLDGDAYAHQAFISGTGEMFHETTNWSNQISNITS